MSKRAKAIPKFSSEAAERAFWEKNDSTEHLDWGKAQVATFPNLKPSRTSATEYPKGQSAWLHSFGDVVQAVRPFLIFGDLCGVRAAG